MKAKQLREKTVQALQAELLSEVGSYFTLRMQKATGQLTQTHLLKSTRRTIARIKTILTEKIGMYDAKRDARRDARRDAKRDARRDARRNTTRDAKRKAAPHIEGESSE